MLIWGLNPANPYGYYIILRIVICAIFLHLVARAFKMEKDLWVWIFGVMAAIYNPIIRVHLTRDLWSVINVLTIIVLALSMRTLRILNSEK